MKGLKHFSVADLRKTASGQAAGWWSTASKWFTQYSVSDELLKQAKIARRVVQLHRPDVVLGKKATTSVDAEMGRKIAFNESWVSYPAAAQLGATLNQLSAATSPEAATRFFGRLVREIPMHVARTVASTTSTLAANLSRRLQERAATLDRMPGHIDYFREWSTHVRTSAEFHAWAGRIAKTLVAEMGRPVEDRTERLAEMELQAITLNALFGDLLVGKGNPTIEAGTDRMNKILETPDQAEELTAEMLRHLDWPKPGAPPATGSTPEAPSALGMPSAGEPEGVVQKPTASMDAGVETSSSAMKDSATTAPSRIVRRMQDTSNIGKDALADALARNRHRDGLPGGSWAPVPGSETVAIMDGTRGPLDVWRYIQQYVHPMVESMRDALHFRDMRKTETTRVSNGRRLTSVGIDRVLRLDDRIFVRKTIETQPAVLIGLLLDVSGSTNATISEYPDGRSRQRVDAIRDAAALIQQALEGMRSVRLAIWTHTTDQADQDVEILRIMEPGFGDPQNLAGLTAKHGNHDSRALMWAAGRLKRLGQEDETLLLIHISDGEPCDVLIRSGKRRFPGERSDYGSVRGDGDPRASVFHTVNAIREELGVPVLAIGVGSGVSGAMLKHMYGEEFSIYVRNDAELPKALKRILTDLLS